MAQHEGAKDAKVAADRLSYAVIGAAIEVHRRLGPGLLESAYQACLAREMEWRGLPFTAEVALRLSYRDFPVDCGYRLDFVVGGLVAVELKSASTIQRIHRMQLLTYLRIARFPLGLLFNFNVEYLRSGIHRIING
jgi:GxxExxY protein